MRITRRATWMLCILGLVLLPACGGGGDGEQAKEEPLVVTRIEPGQGITIQQVDFDWPGGNDFGSTWGRLLVDRGALIKYGVADGFVSVVTAKGWAVINVPVPEEGEPPHAIFFDLGLAQSGAIDDTPVEIYHGNRPVGDIREHVGQPGAFPVERWVWQAHGIGPWAELEKAVPPDDPPYTLAFKEIPIWQRVSFSHMQSVTNVQCALNQCFPMATANYLQFLENEGALVVPHNHAMGIGVPGDATVNTLVGQLDLYANRTVSSRTNGSGVWFAPMIDGTFEYLQDNGLDGILTFRHQDRGYGSTIAAGNYSAFGSTSLDDGATVSWNWIDDRMLDGCGTLMVFIAHAVRITGSGQTLALPWIRYSHDSNQYNDGSGLENVITYLSDPDGNGLLNMDGSSLEVRWVWAACP